MRAVLPMKLLLSVAIVTMVLACAAPGPKYTDIAASFPKLKASEGRIYFYRSSHLGFAIQPTVYLNGEPIGTAVPGGFYFVDRSPGDYKVSATTEVEKQLTFTLASGEEKYVRLSPTFGVLVGRIVPELVDKEEGSSELKELNFVAAAKKN